MIEPAPSDEFLTVFRAAADREGVMTFARFMELALYHPQVGYYQQPRLRVGYAPGSDFFTATSSGSLFGEAIAAAAARLLRAAGRDPARHTFVEIGAEPSGGVLANVAHPFASERLVRPGDPLAITGECVVFSNELFDAQPFRRTVFRRGEWRELGVRLHDGTLEEIELPGVIHGPAATEGYHLDRPEAARRLAAEIAAQPWRGLFLAFDYGKTWRELTEHTPQGTARAYHQHTQSNDLLARPGEQDLTCHVCWDWLEDASAGAGFTQLTLQSQEAFLIREAGEFLAQVAAAEAAGFSRRKQALQQLLHPSHLGQKFQVLSAFREAL